MRELDAGAIVHILNRHSVRFIVIGGLAAQVHDLPVPATVDIDVTPRQRPRKPRTIGCSLRRTGSGALHRRRRRKPGFPGHPLSTGLSTTPSISSRGTGRSTSSSLLTVHRVGLRISPLAPYTAPSMMNPSSWSQSRRGRLSSGRRAGPKISNTSTSTKSSDTVTDIERGFVPDCRTGSTTLPPWRIVARSGLSRAWSCTDRNGVDAAPGSSCGRRRDQRDHVPPAGRSPRTDTFDASRIEPPGWAVVEEPRTVFQPMNAFDVVPNRRGTSSCGSSLDGSGCHRFRPRCGHGRRRRPRSDAVRRPPVSGECGRDVGTVPRARPADGRQRAEWCGDRRPLRNRGVQCDRHRRDHGRILRRVPAVAVDHRLQDPVGRPHQGVRRARVDSVECGAHPLRVGEPLHLGADAVRLRASAWPGSTS